MQTHFVTFDNRFNLKAELLSVEKSSFMCNIDNIQHVIAMYSCFYSLYLYSVTLLPQYNLFLPCEQPDAEFPGQLCPFYQPCPIHFKHGTSNLKAVKLI